MTYWLIGYYIFHYFQCNNEVSPNLPGVYTDIKEKDKSKSMLFSFMLNGLTWFLKLFEWNYLFYLK